MDTKFKSLSCAIPNSSKRFTFRTVVDTKIGREYLTICSSNEKEKGKIDGPDSVERQSVHNANFSLPRAYLKIVPFCGTLFQWLDQEKQRGKSMHCELHAGLLDELRPKEELRRIIAGIMEAACELHDNKGFHGHLDDPRNYALSLVDDYCGRGDIHHVEVTLLNVEGTYNKGSSKTDNEVKEEIKNDLKDLRQLIFTKLLGFAVEDIVKEKPDIGSQRHKIPRDLIHLCEKMVEMDPITLREHPALWHYDRRFHYYARLLSMLFSDSDQPNTVLQTALDGMHCVTKTPWQENVKDALLLTVLKYKDVTYGDDGVSLCRFTKAVTLHLNDKLDPQIHKIKLDKLIRDTFPDFLVESFMAMARNSAFC